MPEQLNFVERMMPNDLISQGETSERYTSYDFTSTYFIVQEVFFLLVGPCVAANLNIDELRCDKAFREHRKANGFQVADKYALQGNNDAPHNGVLRASLHLSLSQP